LDKPVFIHSDITGAVPLYKDFISKRSLDGFCEAASVYLLKMYGDRLTFPAFNYDFKDGGVFNPDKDKAQVGALPEYIRLSGVYCRSKIPFFSILSKNIELCQYSSEVTPLGRGSFFEWLHHNDGTILSFGSKFTFTFMHYIESLIPGGPLYRYEKEFNGFIETKENNKKINCKLHVRPKNKELIYNTNLIESDLRKSNILIYDDKYGISSSMECSKVVPYLLLKYEDDPLYGLTEKSKTDFMKLTNNCTSRVKIHDFE
jgi:aminoglycoside N3'-acetyltransferase